MGKLAWQAWHLPQTPTSAAALEVWHGVAEVWHLPQEVWQQHLPPSPASSTRHPHQLAVVLMPLMMTMTRHGGQELPPDALRAEQ